MKKHPLIELLSEEDVKYLVELETIPEFLDYIKNTFKERSAIVDNGITYTYESLYVEIQKVVGALKAMGVKKGDHVGLVFPNSYDLARISLGAMAMGAVPLICPYQLDANSLFGSAYKYDLKGFITANEVNGRLETCRYNLPHLFYLSIEEFDRLLEESSFDYEIKKEDSACIMFSGGTTGVPKGALLSHLNLMTSTRFGCMGVRNYLYQVYYTILPMSHIFGLVRSFLTPLYSGSVVHFAKNMNNIFKEMPAIKPTTLILVPGLCEVILNVIKRFGFNIVGGALKVIIAGAATVPPYFVKEYDHYGVTLFPGYGLTESTNLVSGNPDSLNRPTSVGIIYPGIEYKVVDEELLIKGPNVFKEYYNDEKENANAFVDGYFKTGDLVSFDEEGFLYITGRSKDIIVLPNGENISPNYVERHFIEIDLVQDCLLYEGEDNLLVLEVFYREAKYFELDEEIREKVLLEQLRKVNLDLPSYMQINRFIIRDHDFERTPALKIIRPKKVIKND